MYISKGVANKKYSSARHSSTTSAPLSSRANTFLQVRSHKEKTRARHFSFFEVLSLAIRHRHPLETISLRFALSSTCVCVPSFFFFLFFFQVFYLLSARMFGYLGPCLSVSAYTCVYISWNVNSCK